jgi:hypothetical protein
MCVLSVLVFWVLSRTMMSINTGNLITVFCSCFSFVWFGLFYQAKDTVLLVCSFVCFLCFVEKYNEQFSVNQ